MRGFVGDWGCGVTREYLLETARRTDFHEEVGLIDEINELFDDFESRTCENCIYSTSKYETEYRDVILRCTHMMSIAYGREEGVAPNEKCRRFERKEQK